MANNYDKLEAALKSLAGIVTNTRMDLATAEDKRIVAEENKILRQADFFNCLRNNVTLALRDAKAQKAHLAEHVHTLERLDECLNEIAALTKGGGGGL